MADVIIDGTIGAKRLIILDSTGKIPAVDGSQVTTIAAGNIATGTIPIARIDTGTTANKIVVLDGSGRLPAVSGALITNIPGATKSASDPTISTNPSGGVGTEWHNTTSGEAYICTDATAGANIWTNVGAGSGDIASWHYGGSQYGFAMGGFGGSPSPSEVIDRWSFASGTQNASDWADLTLIKGMSASTKSTTYGYTVGGSPGPVTDIQKFPFATQTNSTDVGDLTAARRAGGGTTSSTHGYSVTGGAASNLGLDKIDKFSYASGGNASLIGGVYEPRQECGSHSSGTHGYVSGGRHGPAYINSIEKHPFASDSDSVDSANLATSTYRGGMGTGSETDGYHFGGFDAGGARTDQIQKFSYSTGTNATDIANLTVASRDGGTCASSTYGYKAGGDYAPGGAAINVIEKFSTTSIANSTDVGDLTGIRYSLTGVGY